MVFSGAVIRNCPGRSTRAQNFRAAAPVRRSRGVLAGRGASAKVWCFEDSAQRVLLVGQLVGPGVGIVDGRFSWHLYRGAGKWCSSWPDSAAPRRAHGDVDTVDGSRPRPRDTTPLVEILDRAALSAAAGDVVFRGADARVGRRLDGAMWLRPNRVALRRTVGPGQGDGSASRIQPRHRHGRLLLRSAQPLAAPHQREHQRLAKAVPSERHRLSARSPEDLAAVAA